MRSIRNLIHLIILVTVFLHADTGSGEDSSGSLKDHVSGGVNVLLRNELWSTFQAEGTDTERTYDFFLATAGAYINFQWENLSAS
mgnify:FL=1